MKAFGGLHHGGTNSITSDVNAEFLGKSGVSFSSKTSASYQSAAALCLPRELAR